MALVAAVAALSAAAAPSVYRSPLTRVASVDPLRAGSIYDSAVVAHIYETLLDVDYVKRPYSIAPGLASLPEVSQDGLEYVFHLKPGHKFANGREVVAEDYVYSLNRLGDLSNASSGAWIMKDVDSVAAEGPRTLRIKLKRPVHYFPWLLTMSYTGAVPREDVERLGSEFGRTACGSGPYRLVEWRRNHKMRFERNVGWPGWTDGTVCNPRPFDVVEYLHVEDPSTKWLMFLGGELDFLGEVARDNWDAVVGRDGKLVPELVEKGIRLDSYEALQVDYIGINMADPVLGKNAKLRQALNCAFDSAAWGRFSNGSSMPCDGPVPPGVEGRLDTPFQYSFDVEKAKRLLEEAGYANGIDPATGRRLVLSVALGRATQDMRESTELLASFFAKIGIVLEGRYFTWEAFLQAVRERRVQMFRMGWVGDYPDAQNFLQLFYAPNASPGPNRSNYSNPAFDRAYEAAMAATDAGARNEAWAKAQEIVREDCPWIFLAFRRSFTLLRPGVGNYHPTDFSYGTEKYLENNRGEAK